MVTDRLADHLFAPSRAAVENLRAEGVPAERVHVVGNVMIDTLCWALPKAMRRLPAPAVIERRRRVACPRVVPGRNAP